MKSVLPTLLVIVLILILGAGYAGKLYLDKYSYSNEKADPDEYFKMKGDADVALFLQDELLEERGMLRGGEVYVSLDTVHRYFDPRFYWDAGEGLLLYTTDLYTDRVYPGEDRVRTAAGDVAYEHTPVLAEGDGVYLSLEFVQGYVDIACELFKDPNRAQIYNSLVEADIAIVDKDTEVRLRGGVKSPILREIEDGETVRVLESLENWTKVKTEDCFIGYIENKRLSGYSSEERGASGAAKNSYTSFARDGKVSLFWQQMLTEQGADALKEGVALAAKSGEASGIPLSGQGGLMRVISPTWFAASSAAGDVHSIANRAYVEAAHAAGMEVWALVDNDINYQFQLDTKALLSSNAGRQTLAANLVEAAASFGIDGLNIDFEQIPQESGEDYVQFIRELHVATRKANLVLSVDIPQAREYTRHYGFRELGVMCDYVVMMGYDEHYAGSAEAGSVASIGFVEEGLKELLSAGVPAQKVINGVPFYTRVWKAAGQELSSEAISMTTQAEFISRNGLAPAWNEETCQNYVEMDYNGTHYQLWMEDHDSLSAKLSVMDALEIGGVAGWKLGLESAEAWQAIGEYMTR